MKIFLTTALSIMLSAFSTKVNDPVLKLYAYQQKVSKGANFSTSDNKTQPIIKQFVFIELKENKNIKISSVWLNGVRIAFDTISVNTPVILEKSLKLSKHPAFDTLVPYTSNKIIQVHLNSLKQIQSKNIPSRFQEYPLVIEYKTGCKRRYQGASFKELDPEVNQ